MRLLSIESDAKTIKGSAVGYLTGILYLAPARESGVMDVCTSRTEGCALACLYDSGRAKLFPAIKSARIARTMFLHSDRAGFIAQLKREIAALVKRAHKRGLIPAVRVNGTSDLPWLAHEMAQAFPEVQFYDYTKHVRPYQRTLPNYALTFSHSGENLAACMDALSHWINVSVVFNTAKDKPLPATWNGYRVIDGDETDLRFLDPQGVIVGLRAKGNARTVASPFVVLA